MTEQQNLADENNYKFYIQIKKNRKLKRKTKYLTPELNLTENINEAFEFKNLQHAEEFLQSLKIFQNTKLRPRIIIKYIGE